MRRRRLWPIAMLTVMVIALATAAVDAAEVGPNDFRISQMGGDGDTSRLALSPAVAYNSQDDLYLVVWYGDDVVDQEQDIYGRLDRRRRVLLR